jgi:hypothetical protein
MTSWPTKNGGNSNVGVREDTSLLSAGNRTVLFTIVVILWYSAFISAGIGLGKRGRYVVITE